MLNLFQHLIRAFLASVLNKIKDGILVGRMDFSSADV
jgi:hypothetical protein